MAGVYKRPESPVWTAWYFDWSNGRKRRRTKKAYADKRESRQFAQFLEDRAAARRDGLVDAVAETLAEQAKIPIVEHIEAFRRKLENDDNTRKHVANTVAFVNRAVDGCGFKSIAEINADDVCTYAKTLQRRGLGVTSRNHHLRAMKAFTRWCHRTRRLRDDPLIAVRLLNAKADRRHERRPLNDSEIRSLIHAAETGPDWVWGTGKGRNRPAIKITGRDRAMLYRLALGTGFRRGELATLTNRDFDLRDGKATVTVHAKYSKNRRTYVQPIDNALAERLRVWIADRPDEGPVFNVPARTAAMIRRDLASVYVDYRNDAGLVADFYSLRHTFVTRLARSNVHPSIAQRLARHSTIALTMNVYTHVSTDEGRAALATLPDFDDASSVVGKIA